MITLGISGTLGAGKGTIVEYLVNKYNFKHYSVGNFLKVKLIKKGQEVDRTNLQNMGNELREKFGPDYITKELYKKAKREKRNAVIESIRNPKEAEFIKSRGGFLFAVTADQKTRYKRIKSRGGEKDNITFAEFKKQEERESQNSDPNAQNLPGCIKLADFKINNNSTLKTLHNKIERIMKIIEGCDY